MPAGRRVGRPTLWSIELQEKLCKHLANGNPFYLSCRLVGISSDCGQRWLTRGYNSEDPTDQYSQFFVAVQKARAEAERKAVEGIREAGFDGKNWTALAWWLERSQGTRDNWKRPAQETTLEIKQDDIDPKELEAIGGRLAQLVAKLK